MTDHGGGPSSTRAYEHGLFAQLAAAVPAGVGLWSATGALVYANQRLPVVIGGPLTTLDRLVEQFAERERPRLRLAVAAARRGEMVGPLSVALDDGPDVPERFCRIELQPARADDELLGGVHGGVRGGVLVIVDDSNRAPALATGAQALATAHDAPGDVDEVTGCWLRATTAELITERLRETAFFGDHVGVAVVSIDDLEQVRRSFGDDGVVALRVALADRLRLRRRPGDVVGHLSENRFTVVTAGLADAAQLRTLSERLGEHAGQPVDCGEATIVVTLSIGATASAGLDDARELLARAEAAADEAGRQRRQVAVVIDARASLTVDR